MIFGKLNPAKRKGAIILAIIILALFGFVLGFAGVFAVQDNIARRNALMFGANFPLNLGTSKETLSVETGQINLVNEDSEGNENDSTKGNCEDKIESNETIRHLSRRFKVSSREIASEYCKGSQLGEIIEAYRIAELAGVDIGLIWRYRADGLSWREIRGELGLSDRINLDRNKVDRSSNPDKEQSEKRGNSSGIKSNNEPPGQNKNNSGNGPSEEKPIGGPKEDKSGNGPPDDKGGGPKKDNPGKGKNK